MSSPIAPKATYPPQLPSHLLAAQQSAPCRVIMHVDMDCFYAQVERERFPHFRRKPLAVVQNGTLCVTTSYEVRARGLPKGGAPSHFLKLCPSMVFAGSVMKRYRAMSRRWYKIFSTYAPGIVVMKRGIDEAYIDLTVPVRERIKGRYLLTPIPHPHPEQVALEAEKRFAAATKVYKEEEAALVAKLGSLSPNLLESSGSLAAAQRASASTDPITALRRELLFEQTGQVIFEESNERWMDTLALVRKYQGKTEKEIEEDCDKIHPINFCRAQKEQEGPIKLIPMAENKESLSKEIKGLKWRPWVGEVFLAGGDNEEQKMMTAAAIDDIIHDGRDDSGMDNEQEISMHGDEEENPAYMLPPPSSLPVPAQVQQPQNPSDLRSTIESQSYPSVAVPVPTLPPPTSFEDEDPYNPSDDYLLCVGSQLAYELRETLFRQTGLTSSAGIAPNPMLAKIASSLHKPNQQSIVRKSIATTFLSPVSLCRISGFGPKAQVIAEREGLITVADVQSRTPSDLVQTFGEKFGHWLIDIGRGEDQTLVEEHGAPLSIGQSKRQKTTNLHEKLELLYWLAANLYDRMVEDELEYNRRPSTLALGWILPTNWAIISRRNNLPYLKDYSNPVDFMYQMAVSLMKENVPENTTLRCLSLTASNFVPLPSSKFISSFFTSVVNPINVTTETEDANNNLNNINPAPPLPPATIGAMTDSLDGPSFTDQFHLAKQRLVGKFNKNNNNITQMFIKMKQKTILDVAANNSNANPINHNDNHTNHASRIDTVEDITEEKENEKRIPMRIQNQVKMNEKEEKIEEEITDTRANLAVNNGKYNSNYTNDNLNNEKEEEKSISDLLLPVKRINAEHNELGDNSDTFNLIGDKPTQYNKLLDYNNYNPTAHRGVGDNIVSNNNGKISVPLTTPGIMTDRKRRKGILDDFIVKNDNNDSDNDDVIVIDSSPRGGKEWKGEDRQGKKSKSSIRQFFI